ncbi:MAG: NAD-dependent epimerase/dehydratase family protein [Bacteroidota bacterium]
MKRIIGITGRTGFIGTHVYNVLSLQPDKYELVDIKQTHWENIDQLSELINNCDAVLHLAAVNRHTNDKFVYDENVRLAELLMNALNNVKHPIQLIFSSSLQENTDTTYGKAKKKSRELFEKWSTDTGNNFWGCIIPNVFGPFGKPFYNSFVATFCYQLANQADPQIQTDAAVPLLYVGDLVTEFVKMLDSPMGSPYHEIPASKVMKVSDVLSRLNCFRDEYLKKGIIPELQDNFDIQLFNTFRSYIPHEKLFPKMYVEHSDNRGAFVELIRLGMGGQVSFSTTLPGITRGNHFHTRKIERFSVIKGKAKMELRRYGSSEVHTFYLDGDNPSYVDIPIWHYHNITNIGEDVLYTIFWISEQYNPEDADTYFENQNQ